MFWGFVDLVATQKGVVGATVINIKKNKKDPETPLSPFFTGF
jgi:hypothetical protein